MTRTTAVDASYTVGDVAARFGLTVRTLHHYDQIGLLRPSDRSGAGYRLYTAADLTRLQHIVVYRRLEMPLDEIARLLESGDTATHLRQQRARVMTRLDGLRELVAAIDNALEKTLADEPMTTDDMRELFGEGFDDAQAEAERRWGDTDAWKQSKERTKRYTKADWAAVKAETEELNAAFLTAFRAGLPPTSAQAMDAAEAHRRHIDARFYACSPEFHRGLADLYVNDPRYTASYDENLAAPGLAAYVRAAMHANADRQEG